MDLRLTPSFSQRLSLLPIGVGICTPLFVSSMNAESVRAQTVILSEAAEEQTTRIVKDRSKNPSFVLAQWHEVQTGKFNSPHIFQGREVGGVRSILSKQYWINKDFSSGYPCPSSCCVTQEQKSCSSMGRSSISRVAQLPQVNPARPAIPTPPPQEILPPTHSPTPVAPPTPPQVPTPGNILQPQLTPKTPDDQEFLIPFPDTIEVKRFEVEGSTVFRQKEFDEVLKDFIGKQISFVELLKARSAVTDLYIKNGYVTSGAIIPEQKLQGGVVKIRVIEGELEDIEVVGTKRLRSNYIRSRLALAGKKPLNQKRLLEALQLLRLNPLIQNITAELSSGSRPGLSLLKVEVAEAKTFSAQLELDNSRSPSVGTFQRQVQLNQANLTGRGDSLSVGYNNTDGSNGGNLSYTLPINPRNGTLSFGFSTISSNVIERPFNVLDINADFRSYELTLRQPVVQTPTKEFALGVTAARRESKATYIQELRSPFPSPGADQQGRTNITELRFFQEYTHRSSREVIAARSQFSFGLDLLSATINKTSPDGKFFLWQGQAQYLRLLTSDTLLFLRANIQLADRALVPLEQFGLGGAQSVRGYRQDLLLGDSGVFASAELRLPIIHKSQRQTILQLIPFADIGTVFNSSALSNPHPSHLASVGLGLQLQLEPRLAVRLDYGIPLVDLKFKGRTWQEHGVYFSILYNPF